MSNQSTVECHRQCLSVCGAGRAPRPLTKLLPGVRGVGPRGAGGGRQMRCQYPCMMDSCGYASPSLPHDQPHQPYSEGEEVEVVVFRARRSLHRGGIRFGKA